MPDRGAAGSTGKGSVSLTAPAVPTLVGKVNEIAWAIVVEAAFQATAISRNESLEGKWERDLRIAETIALPLRRRASSGRSS
jgi:hypothetical protein